MGSWAAAIFCQSNQFTLTEVQTNHSCLFFILQCFERFPIHLVITFMLSSTHSNFPLFGDQPLWCPRARPTGQFGLNSLTYKSSCTHGRVPQFPGLRTCVFYTDYILAHLGDVNAWFVFVVMANSCSKAAQMNVYLYFIPAWEQARCQGSNIGAELFQNS